MILLLPLLLVACDQPPTEPVALEQPSYDWMNNPDNGNLRVFRYETHRILCFTGVGSTLRACHSTGPLGGPMPDADCGPQEMLEPLSTQEIGEFDVNDVVGSWLHANQKGAVWITVRDVNTTGDCFGNRLVAEGWGSFHYTDNDLFGSGPDDQNANAWGFVMNGRLTRPDGSMAVYQGRNQFVFNEQQLVRVISSTTVIR
jgi:hypothetical protein